MGKVLTLPLKCPLCAGDKRFHYFNPMTDTMAYHDCSMCNGTGLRPLDAELQRRAAQATLQQPTEPALHKAD